MPNIINPNCPSLPEQVEKNTQDILKILASNLEELTGLEFNPINLTYENGKAILNGKFNVIRDDTSVEINGVVTLPLLGENGIIVDASEDGVKIRIALEQEDRELLTFVEELVDKTSEENEIVFTTDMQTYVQQYIASLLYTKHEVLYYAFSSDIELNKGYTGGIDAGQSLAGLDFSPYQNVLVLSGIGQYYMGNISFLSPLTAGNYEGCGVGFDYPNGSESYYNEYMFSVYHINSAKNTFTHVKSGKSQTINNMAKVYAIIGVKYYG